MEYLLLDLQTSEGVFPSVAFSKIGLRIFMKTGMKLNELMKQSEDRFHRKNLGHSVIMKRWPKGFLTRGFQVIDGYFSCFL